MTEHTVTHSATVAVPDKISVSDLHEKLRKAEAALRTEGYTTCYVALHIHRGWESCDDEVELHIVGARPETDQERQARKAQSDLATARRQARDRADWERLRKWFET